MPGQKPYYNIRARVETLLRSEIACYIKYSILSREVRSPDVVVS
jgi:hypothetical protein